LNLALARHDALHAQARNLSEWPIRDDRVDCRGRDYVWQVRGIEIGWAEHDASRYAVHLDQRDCRRELIASREQYRSTAELVQSTSERRADREIRQSNGGIARPERAIPLETSTT
jgi:hypothetical protein